MIPPLVLTFLVLALRSDLQDLPTAVWWGVLGLFFVCPLIYHYLIQVQRREIPKSSPETTSASRDRPAIDLQKAPKTPQPQVRPISEAEEKELRNCFPWGTYYLQNLDYHPQAILCRGRLRATPEVAYQTIRQNIEQKFGDRFVIVFQEGAKNRPFFALVPNRWSKSKSSEEDEELQRPGLALALLAITLFTTTIAGAMMAGVSTEEIQSNSQLLRQGLPYSLSLMAILGVHELFHYLTTLRYRIKATLPYFVPIPFFIGTFGAITQMRSPVPNRRALFDTAIAGPLGGFIVSLPILIWGLSLSEVAKVTETTSLFNFDSLDPRFSLFMATLSKIALGAELSPGTAIDLHPIAIAGYLGIVVTALNLMPVGQLDGGHIVHAMFGQRTAAGIGQVARLLLLGLSLIHQEFLIWAIILLFMPILDEPALNDVTELDSKRDILGLISLAILIAILLPIPDTVTQWLNL
ncbi:MAG: site-2 protease family protein [Jaaginema sp. PMC 1079.18]|nr:site-2 protease family protein [Jaaginema sp. PMC 1080.18]MEC4851576.1 site-2 protease family protein [Jaaginema sp. PMC 1079.18]MEC4867317.1 site-2 protease family protein [Jaaginema sp. PMC 1078.18]